MQSITPPSSPSPTAQPLMAFEPLDVMIPPTLQHGEGMLKVTQNKVAHRHFRVDLESASIVWESKRGNAVHLYAIRDVRVGADAQSYRQALQISDVHEPRWISIIYQTERAYKAVHIVALSDESLARWRVTLLRILAQWQALVSGHVSASRAQCEWLQASWMERALDERALQLLCERMGVQISKPELHALFVEADAEHRGTLNFEAFQTFVTLLKRRPDLHVLYKVVSNGHAAPTVDAFAAFVRTEQGEWTWSDEHILHLFQRFRIDTLDGFCAFMTSRHCGAYPYTERSLDAPLSSYYISSSHNTYLEGGQWKGDSTVEGYVRALHRGARCVELDCWDGPNGQPQVTHGHTLTSRVPLDDVVAAIAQYAFVSSPYPLILSLEVHNDLAQQTAVAHILRSRLGDMLVTAPLEDGESNTLPSPEQLRYRILVKCKDHEWIRSQPVVPDDDGSRSSSTDMTGWESDSFFEQARHLVRIARQAPRRGVKVARPMSPELVRLLVYTIGVPCRGLNKKEQYAVEHMFSLSERSAARLIRHSAADLVKHNLTHLTRVYPSMTKLSRVTSSANFRPVDMWAAGCQLVALNWQTHDDGMAQNLAMFTRSAGYVRKPDALCMRTSVKNDGTLRVNCILTLVSARQLPNVRVDDALCPFATVSVDVPHQWGKDAVRVSTEHGHDYAGRQVRTPSVRANGLLPLFQSRVAVQVCLPAGLDTRSVLAQRAPDAETRARVWAEATRGLLDLCFVRIQLWDEQAGTNVPLATTTLSLGRVGCGYRHVPLYDMQLSPLVYSTLFIHTSYTHIDLATDSV